MQRGLAAGLPAAAHHWDGPRRGMHRRGLLFEYGPLVPVHKPGEKNKPPFVQQREAPQQRDPPHRRGRFRSLLKGLRAARSSRTVSFLIQFLRVSSVHGVGHIGTARPRHPAERLLWGVIVSLAMWGAASISMATWRHYRETPTVISLERDYMAWNTTFPAITVCLGTKTDAALVEAVVQQLSSEFHVSNESNLMNFVERLAGATLFTLSDIPDEPAIPSDRYLDIVEKVSPLRNKSVIDSLNAAAAFYNAKLVLTLTEHVPCHSFNSQVAAYVSPQYWALGEEGIQGPRGLLEVNPMDGSVFAQLSSLPGGYQVFVHGPGEVPDLLSPFLTSPEGQFKRFEVSALAIHTTTKARGLSPHQRRCRFTDEPDSAAPSLHLPVYSYNLCRRACRAHLARSLCGCAPHLYGPLCESVREPVPYALPQG